MKILWFSLSPCGSMRKNKKGVTQQGWLISLEDAIKKMPDVDLYVAYISATESQPFDFEGVHYVPMLEPRESTVNRIFSRHFFNITASNNILIPQLKKAVDFAKPDLIHIHGTEERFGLIAEFVKNIPIIYSIQGLIAPCSKKYWSGIPRNFAYHGTSLIDRVRGISPINNYKNFKKRANREIEYLTHAKYIFGRTFWDRRITLLLNPARKYYQAEELLRNNFINEKWTKPDQISKLRIVTTISDGMYKGHETILAAASHIQNFTSIPFEWIVIGCNADSPRLKMAEKYTKLKAADCNVVPAGRMTADKMVEVLKSSHIYCQVSHIENSPNSVCEALLFGIPTIASFAGGTATLTKGDESEALLYQDGDAYALAGSIVEVYTNYEAAVERGKKARESALLRHNPSAIASQYVDYYIQIIEDFKNNDK